MGGRGAISSSQSIGHTFIDNRGTRFTYTPARNDKGEKGYIVTISGNDIASSSFQKSNATLKQIRDRALSQGMITKEEDLRRRNRR